MGLKYSINNAGRIVAERDIYSLGGFIPKGRLGGFIKDETQLSQEGECWLDSGDISSRPDIVIKDNTFIGGFFRGENPVHTDIVTEFSGNTLIPGSVSIRCFAADTKNNVFVKDSFIGVSMDVLCGPESTTTAFPFGQGAYNSDAAKGTLFENMVVTPIPVNICRSFADLRLGKDTYLYIPTGYNCRVLWAYYDTSDRLSYSGESTSFAAGLHKLSHPVYKVARMHIAKVNGTAMTPTDLLATGAKILGHISSSVLTDIRPESVSGDYVMVNSSFIAETDNFGLATTQLRFLAGGLFSTNMYTLTNRQDYKPYGTFRNVERLEYNQYFADIHRGNVNRDRYITALDSPLVRIGDGFVSGDLVNAGGLTLRRCIVPKGIFQNDVIDGNTYEGIDFSYTNEFMGNTVGNRVFVASRKQGLYGLYARSGITIGFASYPDNTKDATSVTEKHNYVPLDGNLIESGTYAGDVGRPYEANKIPATNRVRFIRPLPTFGANIPSLPARYAIRAVHYLDEAFITRKAVENPTTIEYEFPFFVMSFQKTDPEASLPVSEFIALGQTIFISDYHKVPEITGSAYVGAGCTVRGDVQLHGDPYVNRVFDVNMWERGTTRDGVLPNYPTWSDRKIPTGAGNRFRFIDTVPVEPGANITCNSGYWITCYFFDANGNYLSSPGWGRIANTAPANSAFVGIIIKKASAASDTGTLIEESDIPLANVKYVRAFAKRRYITNELDRTSPEDILIGPDYWEQGGLSVATANAGKPYEGLKTGSPYQVRLKRPFGFGAGYRAVFSSGYSFGTTYYDAATGLLYGSTSANRDNALFALVGNITDSPTAPITPADVTAGRLIIEFTPSPRITVPYGVSNLLIEGTKVRMYDNSVLSRTITQGQEVTLKGDAVMGSVFTGDVCICSNGHDDAIITKP